MQNVVGRGESLKVFCVTCKAVDKAVSLYSSIPSTQFNGLVDVKEVDLKNKLTLKYIDEHCDDLAKTWKKKAEKAGYETVYDLTSDLYIEMAKKEDYSPTYVDEDGRIIPIEGYIYKTLTNLCKRKQEDSLKYSRNHVSLYVDDGDDQELSLLGCVADESAAEDFDRVEELNSFKGQQIEAVKRLNMSRNKYGSDLINVSYVIAKSLAEQISQEAMRAAVHELCGIDHLSKAEQKAFIRDDAINESMQILIKEPQKSVEMLSPLVRGKKTVDSLIKKARV